MECTNNKVRPEHVKPDNNHSVELYQQTDRPELEIIKKGIWNHLNACATESLEDAKPEMLRGMEFNIELIDPDQQPIRCKSRPLPFAIKEQVKLALNAQLEAGLIRRSRSEWAAPLHIVIKPDGSIRLTADYKALNAVIKFDPYPMPNTKDLFNKLAKSKSSIIEY